MSNPYIPRQARIDKVINETIDVKTFRLVLDSELSNEIIPGQFIMVVIFGIGEAPFAIASAPSQRKIIEASIRSVGDVTKAFHRLKEGDVVGIRGPFGNGYPLDELRDKNLIFIAGGTGLFGLSSMLWYVYENRNEFQDVILFYGTRAPDTFMRMYDVETWSKKIDVYLTVDKPTEGWKGRVGVVTSLLDITELPRDNVAFLICGPPLMLKAAYKKLLSLGYKPSQMYVSLERHMKCGIGKCGRCMLKSGLYVCKDGPVFRCDKLPERDIE